MRIVRRFLAVSVLAFTLVTTMHAGVISTPAPQPTPAPAQGEISTTLNGDMHTGAPGDIHTTETSADVTLAGAVVDLVQGVLALL